MLKVEFVLSVYGDPIPNSRESAMELHKPLSARQLDNPCTPPAQRALRGTVPVGKALRVASLLRYNDLGNKWIALPATSEEGNDFQAFATAPHSTSFGKAPLKLREGVPECPQPAAELEVILAQGARGCLDKPPERKQCLCAVDTASAEILR